ncbi:MAG: hypothetical protein ACRD2L_05680, partial [Terriglobia bacterium]
MTRDSDKGFEVNASTQTRVRFVDCGEEVRTLSESNVVQNNHAPLLSGIALQGKGKLSRLSVSATVHRDYPNRIQ